MDIVKTILQLYVVMQDSNKANIISVHISSLLTRSADMLPTSCGLHMSVVLSHCFA